MRKDRGQFGIGDGLTTPLKAFGHLLIASSSGQAACDLSSRHVCSS